MTNHEFFSKYADYLRPGQKFHFTRGMVPKAKPSGPHSHDHFELFWLYHGHAAHLINGQRQKLSEGDVVFFRPDDNHSLQGRGEETHFINLILPPEIVDEIFQRHPNLKGRFFDDPGHLPRCYTLDSLRLADLSRAAKQLEEGPRSRLAIEAFLLTLFAGFSDSIADRFPVDIPDWLRDVCIKGLRPALFQTGSAGLARASGKTHAHVSRMMQKHLGQSPSEFINRIRMEHAADRLVGSYDTLPEISQACGIENMSHFHRLFKTQHGLTPRAFRLKYQRDVIRPK